MPPGNHIFDDSMAGLAVQLEPKVLVEPERPGDGPRSDATSVSAQRPMPVARKIASISEGVSASTLPSAIVN